MRGFAYLFLLSIIFLTSCKGTGEVSAGSEIGEVKVLDRFKIHAALSEYYVDRITAGLPASLQYQERRYPLKVSKVWPEVKDRSFEVDLVFTDSVPDNVPKRPWWCRAATSTP